MMKTWTRLWGLEDLYAVLNDTQIVDFEVGHLEYPQADQSLSCRYQKTHFRALILLRALSGWLLCRLLAAPPRLGPGPGGAGGSACEGGIVFGFFPHILSNLQKNWQIFSSLSQIDYSTSSSVSPHPDRCCICSALLYAVRVFRALS